MARRAHLAQRRIPNRPAWIDEAVGRLRWRAEEWRCRWSLCWMRWYESAAAAMARGSARAADRLERGRIWAADRLHPVLWRMSTLWRARAEAAALRRATLAARIASLRERHLEPVVRAVEQHAFQADAAERVKEAARRAGLSRVHLLAAGIAALLIGWAAWQIVPASVPPLSDDEIAMLAGFQRLRASDDPTAWRRGLDSPVPAAVGPGR